jgi:hypothetical protein
MPSAARRGARRIDRLRQTDLLGAPVSGRQSLEIERSDAHAYESQDRMADSSEEPAHLAVASAAQADAHPDAVSRMSGDDGWRPGRQRGFRVETLEPARATRAVAEHDTLRERVCDARPVRSILGIGRLAEHLREIDLLHAMARIGDARLQAAVVRQQQESFRIEVESARGVHAVHRDELRERAAIVLRRELRQHAVRFVEADEPCHELRDEMPVL